MVRGIGVESKHLLVEVRLRLLLGFTRLQNLHEAGGLVGYICLRM